MHIDCYVLDLARQNLIEIWFDIPASLLYYNQRSFERSSLVRKLKYKNNKVLLLFVCLFESIDHLERDSAQLHVQYVCSFRINNLPTDDKSSDLLVYTTEDIN